jgi:micrococcal nuclease
MTVPRQNFFVLVFLIVHLVSACATTEREPFVGSSAPLREAAVANPVKRVVLRVVDGDTIVVSPNEKVRLIGVDTPETVHPTKGRQCFGMDAKQFTRDSIEGKSLRLEFDEANRRTGHKDKYGRTLAYAYLDDGRMLNRELIRQGYAHAYTRFPFRHRVEFIELANAARAHAVGLWASCPLN